MIDRVIEFSVRRRGWLLLAVIVTAAAGAWAVLNTPVDAVPDLSENQVIVYAEWPGHGPEEVEQHVTYPLSLLYQGLAGVRAVRGSSDVGYSTMYLIFDDAISFEEARRRTQERLAASSHDLPDGVTARMAPDGIPTGQIFWYTVEGGGLDLAALRALQDWSIAPQLRSVPGVAEVASVGGFVREIHLTLDLPRVRAAGLFVSDIADAVAAAEKSAGGHVVHKGNAEYVVQLGHDRAADSTNDPFGLAGLRELIVPVPGGGAVRLGDVARVSLGAAARRGMLEKDGNEVVGGVVHLRHGHNTLEVTRRVKEKLRDLEPGLPPGVRLRPCYDRTPLISGAVATVGRALLEAIVVASLCVVLILRHVRAALVVSLTLPLAVLGAYLAMWGLRRFGIVDVQTNIMSLAGLVISIGVLVDSSIVMSENAMFQLRRRFGDRPVRGDVDGIVIRACQSVGRPVFFSVLIMLVSFLPVFSLGGIDGKMYAPLAWTKTLALLAAAVLAIVLVPALCALFIRGRMRDESESWLVRSVIQVYRPILSHLLDRPGPLVGILPATAILAAAALGLSWLLLSVLAIGIVATGATLQTARWRWSLIGALILMALVAEQSMRPLRTELRMPLDEGMVMDMPITVPRASIAQSADDLKARDMILCRFPEVHMVVGKAGRAETPFDPAPLDMIETMIEFRPQSHWPRRRLLHADAEQHAWAVWRGLTQAELVDAETVPEPAAMVTEAVDAGLLRYDAIQREIGHLKVQQFFRKAAAVLGDVLVRESGRQLHRQGLLVCSLAPGDVAAVRQSLPLTRLVELANGPSEAIVDDLAADIVTEIGRLGLLRQERIEGREAGGGDAAQSDRDLDRAAVPGVSEALQEAARDEYERLWSEFLPELNAEHFRRAPRLWTRIISEELIERSGVADNELADVLRQAYAARYAQPQSHKASGPQHHHGLEPVSKLPLIDPHPAFDTLQQTLSEELAGSLLLWPHDPQSLAGFGGEMDRALQMPGWTNVWTRPIQNRVDMLTTGVNAEVGVRVLGRDLDAVVQASEDIAAALRELPGASDVVADPIRGKGYLRITPDPARMRETGVSRGEFNDLVEAALAGRLVTHRLAGRERVPVRLTIGSPDILDEESIRRLPVPVRRPPNTDPRPVASAVTLDAVADVEVAEGPATVKSENGWLRNYVRFNVQGRDPLELVEDAKRVVAAQVSLPPGVFVEWTGQFEHTLSTRKRLLFLMPVVLGTILLILYLTYRDWADAALMVLAVPGALAGGILCQWLLAYPFSVAVGMGYIACFGMAAATGIVMLVYLREAVERRGGLEAMTLSELRAAVLDGAVHRLRPKLLTEATTVLSLAPMLWSTGVGADVIRPMAAPVLGGILIADEVIDLLLPILFYHVRRRRWRHIHERAPSQASPAAAPAFSGLPQ